MKKIKGEDDEFMAPPVLQRVYEMIVCVKFLNDPRWINPCHPWNTWEELDLATEQMIRNEWNDEAADTDGSITTGYEFVNIDSLTINQVIQRAMVAADLDSYALAVPIAFNDHTSRIPVMIESCPPTITRVSTFGSFHESHIFEKTPIVVEVSLLYSTGARIAWFANGQLVCANSSCYTPTGNDVDKVLTVVIMPQRPDHDGRGCEEAYQFKRRVDALPLLPIIRPLREDFMNRPLVSRDDPSMSLRRHIQHPCRSKCIA